MTDLVPHREPHQRTAALARGVAVMLDDDWTTALRTARRAAHTPPDSITASGAGVRSVGTHSDPTATAAIGASVDHPLAHRVAELNRAHANLFDALTAFANLVESTLDHDRRTLDRLAAAEEIRAAQPQHRYCWACDSPCERADGCDACRALYRRTNPAEYLVVAGDQTDAAKRTAFARWVQRRVAEGSLARPGSPHTTTGGRMLVHEDDVA